MVKAVAFYLPQYHPVPENDRWWGQGFTEWRNVSKAAPRFPGHYQPHAPGELGFYDLRESAIQKRQAELARDFGLHGFCYYYYWFNGRRILERPLTQLLEHPEIDFPYCVCWANENWTRRWDGNEEEVLLAQQHSPEDDAAFLQSLVPMLRDPRYIRVDGKPMLLVYRANLFPDPIATTDRWRRMAGEMGLGGLHLCAVLFNGIEDPRSLGFDAGVEFPPHKLINSENDVDEIAIPHGFRGRLVDYQKVASQALAWAFPADRLIYRGVMPSWDNTPRRKDSPHVFVNSSPSDYHHWLRRLVEDTEERLPADQQFIFINAWNEWGEGCHLEPDVKYGLRWLRATHSALRGERLVDELVKELRESTTAEEVEAASQELIEAYDARERSLYAMKDALRRKDLELAEQRGLLELLARPEHRLLVRAREELDRFPRLKEMLKKAFRSNGSAITSGQ
jgi:lipopolysaccharide biosynthesis protein